VDLGKSQAAGSRTDEDSPADYCRAIDGYLCRKNDGHLIRIVGPSFDMVCGWAARGIPATVAQRGIDRCVERYYAKGPRRRPVRIDFCEADVLDVFDEWRRAVGVQTAADEPVAAKHESLPRHLERVVARLTAMRAGGSPMDPLLDAAVRELDAARDGARTLRGSARDELLRRLKELDAQLLSAARSAMSDSEHDEVRHEAEAELAAFRARMPQAAFAASVAACVDRLVRDRFRLPILSLE
jgi:hypothetical protein